MAHLSKRPLNLAYALGPGDEVIGYRFERGYRVTKRSAQGVAIEVQNGAS